MIQIRRKRWILTRTGRDGRMEILCGITKNTYFAPIDELKNAAVKTYMSKAKAMLAYEKSWRAGDVPPTAVEVMETIEEAGDDDQGTTA